MENTAAKAYAAWPERLYVVLDGVVVYKGGLGPDDYRVEEVEAWIAKHVAATGAVAETTTTTTTEQ